MVSFLKKKKHKVVVGSAHDLCKYEDALELTDGVDMCFSFAANMGGIGYFSQANYYPVIDNFLIDLNILRACEKNKVKRLFYPASACAYPLYLMNKGKALEESMLNAYAKPDQMYGWEKLTMIKLMRNSPLDVRIGVLHTIYGEGQEYEGEKAKFPPQIAYKAICGNAQVYADMILEAYKDSEMLFVLLTIEVFTIICPDSSHRKR